MQTLSLYAIVRVAHDVVHFQSRTAHVRLVSYPRGQSRLCRIQKQTFSAFVSGCNYTNCLEGDLALFWRRIGLAGNEASIIHSAVCTVHVCGTFIKKLLIKVIV